MRTFSYLLVIWINSFVIYLFKSLGCFSIRFSDVFLIDSWSVPEILPTLTACHTGLIFVLHRGPNFLLFKALYGLCLQFSSFISNVIFHVNLPQPFPHHSIISSWFFSLKHLSTSDRFTYWFAYIYSPLPFLLEC